MFLILGANMQVFGVRFLLYVWGIFLWYLGLKSRFENEIIWIFEIIVLSNDWALFLDHIDLEPNWDGLIILRTFFNTVEKTYQKPKRASQHFHFYSFYANQSISLFKTNVIKNIKKIDHSPVQVIKCISSTPSRSSSAHYETMFRITLT